MPTKAEKALVNAIQEEVDRDHLFLEKCKYHNELMEELFHSKGLTDYESPEAEAVFEEVGKRMEAKYPGYLKSLEVEQLQGPSW